MPYIIIEDVLWGSFAYELFKADFPSNFVAAGLEQALSDVVTYTIIVFISKNFLFPCTLLHLFGKGRTLL